MLFGETFITSGQQITKPSFAVQIEEICEKTEPKPLFCEPPDDLKFTSISQIIGTAQTYTYSASATISSYNLGTSLSFGR